MPYTVEFIISYTTLHPVHGIYWLIPLTAEVVFYVLLFSSVLAHTGATPRRGTSGLVSCVAWRLAVPEVGPVAATADLEPAVGGTRLRLRWAYLGDPPADGAEVERILQPGGRILLLSD